MASHRPSQSCDCIKQYYTCKFETTTADRFLQCIRLDRLSQLSPKVVQCSSLPVLIEKFSVSVCWKKIFHSCSFCGQNFVSRSQYLIFRNNSKKKNFTTVIVKQLQHHQATKLVDCRVFILIFTGTKSTTVAQETTELLSIKRGTFLCFTVSSYIFFMYVHRI